MLQTPGNVTLPQMILNMESQNIVNRGREQEQQKVQQEMVQKQQAQATVQQVLQQQAANRQPVTPEFTTELSKISAKDSEKAQINEWQHQFKTNMALAEALAPVDHIMADEYRKTANSYKGMINTYIKDDVAVKKDQAKTEGGILNVMWPSPEGYVAGLENLRQVNPELATRLEKQFPEGLTLGAARTIKAEADSRMSVDQQQAATLAVQKAIDDVEHKQETRQLQKERNDIARQAVIDRRENLMREKGEKETKAQIATRRLATKERQAQADYDKDYQVAHKDYLAAKKIFDKEQGSLKKSIFGIAEESEMAKSARENMQAAYEAQLAANKRYVDNINTARMDAEAAGAPMERTEAFTPRTALPKKVDQIYASTVPSLTASQVIAKYKEANPNKAEEELIMLAKKDGRIK